MRANLAHAQECLGRDHRTTLTAMNNLALVLGAVGDKGQAVALLEECLALSESGLGPAQPATLDTLRNLAAIYRDTGQLDKAALLEERAMAWRRRRRLLPRRAQ